MGIKKLMSSPPETGEDKNYALIVNALVEATLLPVEASLEIKGTLSLHLEASLKELENGVVKMQGFNLVFSDVPQKAITNKSTETKYASMGMPMHSTGNIQLNLDAERKTFKGTIPVRAYFPQIDEIFPPNFFDSSGRNDHSISQTQQGNIELSIKADPLLDVVAGKIKINSIDAISLSSMVININSLTIGKTTIPGYGIKITDAELPVQVADLKTSRVIKKFLVQLVSVRDDPSDSNATGIGNGKGFNYGLRAINDLWDAFGVKITANPDWIYLDCHDWKIPKAEVAETILSKVDEKLNKPEFADCIGIVFVENFNPAGLNGGGWTIRSGTNLARIITSDGNVAQKDCTHLAHELGHAFGLIHPNETDPNLRTATAGTLMEPSGWRVKNPYINSLENARNVRSSSFRIIARAMLPAGPAE